MILKQQIHTLNETIADLQHKLNKETEINYRFSKERYEESERYKAQSAEARAYLENLRSDLEKVKRDNSAATGTAAELQSKNTELVKQLEQIHNEYNIYYTNNNKEIQSLRAQLETSNTTAEQLRKEFDHNHNQDLDSLRRQLAGKDEIINLTQKEANERENQYKISNADLRKKENDLNKELNSWKKANADNVKLAEKLAEKNKQLNAHITELEKQLRKEPSPIQTGIQIDTRENIEIDITDDEMQLSGLHEFVSIPLREKIPLFSGYLASDVDIHEWFSDAERIAKGAYWTNDQKKRYFSERFIKLAQAYQEELEAHHSFRHANYEDWKKLVIAEFEDPNRKEKFKIDLQNISQNDCERVSQNPNVSFAKLTE